MSQQLQRVRRRTNDDFGLRHLTFYRIGKAEEQRVTASENDDF